MNKTVWTCRWCGDVYKPKQETPRDGFCCTGHKQAHHRAYKKYVTSLDKHPPTSAACRVTQKKKKK